MLKVRLVLGVVATTAGLLLAGGMLSPVQACGNMCGDGGGGAENDGGRTVTVTVTGSFVGGGSDGSGGSGSTTVPAPSPCYFMQLASGQENFEFWYPNGPDKPPRTITGPPDEESNRQVEKPPPGVKEHRNDEGHWYTPVCVYRPGEFEDFDRIADEWFAENETTWVPAGTTPPVPPVPASVLLQAAEESLTIPQPVFEWNPKRTGNQGTLVNLPTWFWLEAGYPTSGTVTATAGANSATIELVRERVEFWSAGTGSVTCNGGGTAWSPGASSSCTLAFGAPGDHTVQAQADWQATWSFNGEPRGSIDPLSAAWSTGLAVGEVQSVVTDVD